MKLSLLYILLICSPVNAQERHYDTWFINAGINLVDSSGDTSPFDVFELKKHAFFNPFSISVGYRLSELFSVEQSLSINTWQSDRGVIDGVPLMSPHNYFAADTGVLFYFDSFLSKERNFQNYLELYSKGGLGLFSLESPSLDPTINFGFGIFFWITDVYGVHIESTAKWTLDNTIITSNHFQHFLGISYRIVNRCKKCEVKA